MVKDSRDMSKIKALHDKAMQLAHLALVARNQGDFDRARELAAEAFELEVSAASLIPEGPESEPTRSIFFQSAASLAYQAENLEEAIRSIAKGLAGYPPARIKKELMELYDEITLQSFLLLQDEQLSEESLNITLRGNAIGWGTIIYNEFERRLKTTKTLIDRTIHRLMKKKYQKAGRISREVKKFEPILCAPTPGSFNITFKFSSPIGTQLNLFFNAKDIVDEIIKGIDLINQSRLDLLEKEIGDSAYFRNFVSHVKELAPDGDKVKFVAFTSKRKKVIFKQKKDAITLPISEELVTEQVPVEIEGILDYAIARKEEAIGLTTKDQRHYTIIVQEGLEDLVRSYFKQWVKISGIQDPQQKNKIYLADINLAEES